MRVSFLQSGQTNLQMDKLQNYMLIYTHCRAYCAYKNIPFLKKALFLCCNESVIIWKVFRGTCSKSMAYL